MVTGTDIAHHAWCEWHCLVYTLFYMICFRSDDDLEIFGSMWNNCYIFHSAIWLTGMSKVRSSGTPDGPHDGFVSKEWSKPPGLVHVFALERPILMLWKMSGGCGGGGLHYSWFVMWMLSVQLMVLQVLFLLCSSWRVGGKCVCAAPVCLTWWCFFHVFKDSSLLK